MARAGDKGYRAEWIDKLLLELDILPVIPSKETDDRDKRGMVFDQAAYLQSTIIQRPLGWLKETYIISLCKDRHKLWLHD